MQEVVDFIKVNGWYIIMAIVVCYNTVMSIINCAKQRKCVKFSDIIIESDVDSLAHSVAGLTESDQLEFFAKYKEYNK